jgi:hypothetical protein
MSFLLAVVQVEIVIEHDDGDRSDADEDVRSSLLACNLR